MRSADNSGGRVPRHLDRRRAAPIIAMVCGACLGSRRDEAGAEMIVVWCVRIILLAAFADLAIRRRPAAMAVRWSGIPAACFRLANRDRVRPGQPVHDREDLPSIIVTVVETLLSAFAIGIASALLFGALLAASSCVTVAEAFHQGARRSAAPGPHAGVRDGARTRHPVGRLPFGAFLAFSVVLVEICDCLGRLPAALPTTAAAGSPSLERSRWSLFLDAWITGLRPAMRFALAGVVIGEYIGSNKGLGYQVEVALQMFDASTMYAALVLLTVIAAALDAFAAKISLDRDRRLLRQVRGFRRKGVTFRALVLHPVLRPGDLPRPECSPETSFLFGSSLRWRCFCPCCPCRCGGCTMSTVPARGS